MIYLERFIMLSRQQEEAFLRGNFRTCYTTKYPFNIFRYRELPAFEFAPVTIFYGGNGSGKSTILNVMAEKLQMERGTVYNRSNFFNDYVEGCQYKLASVCGDCIPPGSRIISSDDVFDYLLNIRYLNENIDTKRDLLFAEYEEARYSKFQMRSMEDYDELKKHADAVRYSGSGYVKHNLMFNVQERSNGESALAFFAETLKENGLYLLDEPENSLAADKLLELRQFLEDSARFYGCQFVISTHSPFLLSIRDARIYSLDITPPEVRPWTELEGMRVYHDFFMRYDDAFKSM